MIKLNRIHTAATMAIIANDLCGNKSKQAKRITFKQIATVRSMALCARSLNSTSSNDGN